MYPVNQFNCPVQYQGSLSLNTMNCVSLFVFVESCTCLSSPETQKCIHVCTCTYMYLVLMFTNYCSAYATARHSVHSQFVGGRSVLYVIRKCEGQVRIQVRVLYIQNMLVTQLHVCLSACTSYACRPVFLKQ